MRHRRLAKLSVIVMAASLPVFSQTPTFSVKTEEVRIDVLVAENGKPVKGLEAADFEVRDNGVPQKIEFIGFEQIPISVTLALDMSSSVAGNLLKHLKAAGSGLLDRLTKEDRAALITFTHAVTLGSPLTTDIRNVKMALDHAQPLPSGNTSLIDASYAGLVLAESRSDRPLLIVFTDGLDTSSWLTNEAVMDIAKRSGTVVYSVSAGQLPNKTFLRNLSNDTGGSLFEVESTRDLGTVFVRILEEFRQRYLLTYSPKGVSSSGWHSLQVRVKHRNVKIMARPGYLVGEVR
jgi:Ca-activated chloride channel family protein